MASTQHLDAVSVSWEIGARLRRLTVAARRADRPGNDGTCPLCIARMLDLGYSAFARKRATHRPLQREELRRENEKG